MRRRLGLGPPSRYRRDPARSPQQGRSSGEGNLAGGLTIADRSPAGVNRLGPPRVRRRAGQRATETGGRLVHLWSSR